MSEHPEELAREREGEAERGMEQGKGDFWPMAGIGDVVMGTRRSCCAWHERGRATVGSSYSHRCNGLGASPEDAEIILAARGQGLGFCAKSLTIWAIWESP